MTSAAPTPKTDAVKVDLRECISIETEESGRRRYVEEYVPVYFARQLERDLAAAHAAASAMQERCAALCEEIDARGSVCDNVEVFDALHESDCKACAVAIRQLEGI